METGDVDGDTCETAFTASSPNKNTSPLKLGEVGGVRLAKGEGTASIVTVGDGGPLFKLVIDPVRCEGVVGT